MLSSIEIKGFKSLKSVQINLNKINVLIGQNNSGKSAFLEAVSSMQEGGDIKLSSIRMGHRSFSMKINVQNINNLPRKLLQIAQNSFGDLTDEGGVEISFQYNRENNTHFNIHCRNLSESINIIENKRKSSIFVRYLTKRKVSEYNENVNLSNFDNMSDNLSLLPTLLSEVTNPSHPSSSFYRQASESILGFVVGNILTEDGQKPGVRFDGGRQISINEMGAGVANIAAFLAELSIANNKVFIIEELENDLYPEALKKILDLIIEKSDNNQFIISTHSNVALTHLSSSGVANIFEFSLDGGARIPTTILEEITNDADKRKKALSNLGYFLSDFNLFDGWIIFEESSMEEIVRDYLIEWFCPSLRGKIRTVSAGGADNTEKHFGELHRMYLYIHLQPIYKGCAWVILDGDEKGKKVRDKLVGKFTEYSNDSFICLQKDILEMYYPDQVDFNRSLFDSKNKNDKDDYKKECLHRFKELARTHEDDIKRSSEESFSEIISLLHRIESNIRPK